MKFISSLKRRQRSALIRIIITTLLVAVLLIIPIESNHLKTALFAVPYFIIGYDILFGALLGIKNIKPFDENFLMSIATVGAFALGDSTEAVAVMLFYQIGEFFQGYAIEKSRRSIAGLMDICPDAANVTDEKGNIIEVDPYTVEIGTIITVRPGERIPIDGVIVSGNTLLDCSSLTGESIPVDAAEGSEVMSGCINLTGLITLRTTRLFSNSTASKILELVESASGAKSRSERFISRFSRIYTPTVCIVALFLALGVPLFNLIIGASINLSVWIYRALTFLVISCPCALVISIPLTFFAGIGTASSQGILIKGSSFLETLSRVKYIVFDKTGTLTKGNFEIAEIHSEIDEKELLRLCAFAEANSNHPIAKCLADAFGDIDLKAIGKLTEISGEGVAALIDGKEVYVGNNRLMKRLNVSCPMTQETGTTVFVAVGGKYKGHIILRDTIKPTALSTLETLKKEGLKTIMLTGDKEGAAKNIANALAFSHCYWELLPEDKVKKTEELIKSLKQGEKLAFVGDGINDAPVLTRADVGIAMGAIGSDAAIEAADIVLTDDDLKKIPKAIAISKKCMTIVYENIFFALGIKLICLVLGALGIANMWIAIFADVGVMVIAVLNALRVMKGRLK